MRLVPLWALRPGMKVARRVYDSKGFLLLNVGVSLEKEYIQSLKRIGIRAIYIDDPLIPDVDIEDVILEETRQKALKLVRDTVYAIKESPSQISTKFITFNKDLSTVLDDIVSQLLVNRNLTVNLADIRSTDDYTLPIRLTWRCSPLSPPFPGVSSEPQDLGLGAFLHDLGKRCCP